MSYITRMHEIPTHLQMSHTFSDWFVQTANETVRQVRGQS